MNFRNSLGVVVGVVGLAVVMPKASFAASDVSNSGSVSRQATSTVSAPVASAQTASLISNAVAGGFVPSGGTGGGFSPGGGGGGGFSPGGGGGGGFTPGGAPGGTGPAGNDKTGSIPYMSTRGMSGGDETSRMGLWTQGTYSHVNKSEASLQMNGNIYNVVAGADYKPTDFVLAGLAVSWERTDIKTVYNNGTFTGSGVSVAPYAGLTLSEAWTIDASVGYSWLNYDVSRTSGAATGSYGAARVFAATNLTGVYSYDAWRFQPRATVSYVHENQDSYKESSGTAIDSSLIQFGRVSGGSKIGYAVGDSIPYIKVLGEWDYVAPSSVLKANGQQSFSGRTGGVIGMGYEVYKGPMVASIEANYNSLFRDNLDLWTFAARFRYEF